MVFSPVSCKKHPGPRILLAVQGHSDFPTQVRQLTDQLGQEGIDVLGALFDLTAQRLVRLAVAMTRNQYDAEDAVQAVMERVARKPASLRDAERPWPYLLRMVRNEALLIVRKKKRWSLSHCINDLVTLRRVDELEQEDTHRQVWTALRSLPTPQAEVVVLKIWEGMTFAQISQLLEVSPNTAASRYQYGMQKLAGRLARTAEEAFEQEAPR